MKRHAVLIPSETASYYPALINASFLMLDRVPAAGWTRCTRLRLVASIAEADRIEAAAGASPIVRGCA